MAKKRRARTSQKGSKGKQAKPLDVFDKKHEIVVLERSGDLVVEPEVTVAVNEIGHSIRIWNEAGYEVKLTIGTDVHVIPARAGNANNKVQLRIPPRQDAVRRKIKVERNPPANRNTRMTGEPEIIVINSLVRKITHRASDPEIIVD